MPKSMTAYGRKSVLTPCGRDITVESFYDIFQDLFVIAEHDDPGDVYRYIGVRDERL